jgi:hypothetical protein
MLPIRRADAALRQAARRFTDGQQKAADLAPSWPPGLFVCAVAMLARAIAQPSPIESLMTHNVTARYGR